MQYKKIWSIVLLFVLGMALVACGSSNATPEKSTPVAVTEPTGEATAKPAPANVQGRPGGGGLGNSTVDTSGIKTQYTDVAYGSVSSSQTLNIYLPNEGEGPFPVIVAIHGGAFRMGSATGGDVAAMLEGVNRGYAVVSINYRLSGEATFPAAVSDCKAAIRFIKANASKYNLDANRIAVWGDSAGGNLAAMVGTTGNVTTLNGDNQENLDYSSAVQAVVDWFGPLNFLEMDAQFAASGITPAMGATSSETSPESQYIGQLITKDPELTQQANPATYINTMTPETAPSFLIQHGTADANVPTQQSIDFADLLTAALGKDKVTLVLLEGAGHGTSEFTAQANLDQVFAFLDQVLKK
ncbi:MAG TPA: alpha/beta hydrolase [Anaerolineae bacterium]|nr:alpha/beta hydrolase [Anaerolineae bacterium]HQI85609.1 alpha/beta hydrolase [Anaerolineae bacterium]